MPIVPVREKKSDYVINELAKKNGDQGKKVEFQTEDVVTMAAEHSPDVIVYCNPASLAAGLDTIKKLKQQQPDIAIILMVNELEVEEAARAIEAGADGFIFKSQFDGELPTSIAKIASGDKASGGDKQETIPLTSRQREIVKMLCDGLTNKQIANALKISVKTVDIHRANIMSRLRIRTLAGLVKFAIRSGLTSLE